MTHALGKFMRVGGLIVTTFLAFLLGVDKRFEISNLSLVKDMTEVMSLAKTFLNPDTQI